MAFNIHTSHRMIFWIPAILYVVLVWICAVYPAMQEAEREAKTQPAISNALTQRGREVFLNYNCGACHTQQIRGDEHLAYESDGRRRVPALAADRRYGVMATDAAHYDHEAPALLGTQRTGPDLTGVGSRLPGAEWHHWHLYAPQVLSPGSIMQPYRFLYATERPTGDDAPDWEEVPTIDALGLGDKRLWASPDARALVEYLLSLQGPE